MRRFFCVVLIYGKGWMYMKLIYDATVIENVLNALNKLPVVGLQNAELLVYIVQQLNMNEPLNNPANGNDAQALALHGMDGDAGGN
jgi:hypothetical protein